MIYLCRNKRNGLVKIGFSNVPERREKTLQSEDPEVFFEHIIPGDIHREQALHRAFAHRRIRGEWFELYPDDIQAIVSGLLPMDDDDEWLYAMKCDLLKMMASKIRTMTEAEVTRWVNEFR